MLLYAKAVTGVFARRPATVPSGVVAAGVEVDREHLWRYSRVCGFRLGDELPVTYPHVLVFPLMMSLMTRGDFPFPLLGLVHVHNTISQRRPVRADEPLSFEVHAENLSDHERGRTVDLITVATVDGTEVWRELSRYLRKEKPAERDQRDRSTPPTPAAVWRVPPETAGEYAAVSGDRNPIHTSTVAARAFGFPRRIAHGMWSKARCLAALEGRLPEAFTVSVAFKLPVLLPATVGFTSTRTAEGREFALFDARSGRPHLAGDLH